VEPKKVLALLQERGPLTMSNLSIESRRSPRTLWPVLRDLRAKGLIERKGTRWSKDRLFSAVRPTVPRVDWWEEVSSDLWKSDLLGLESALRRTTGGGWTALVTLGDGRRAIESPNTMSLPDAALWAEETLAEVDGLVGAAHE